MTFQQTISDERMIEHLRYAKKMANLFSKDESTKVGAFILDPAFGDIIPSGTGYNGFPRGCNDDVPERKERPEKYLWTEHAERNAFFNVARYRLEGGVAVLSYAPDIVAARAIASTGIRHVMIPKNHRIEDARVEVIFQEANVSLLRDKTSAWNANLRGDKIGKYAELVGDQGKGAILLSKDGRILGDVHGGLAENEDPARIAIYNVARYDTNGCYLVATMMPCSECADAAIRCGIAGVITERPNIDRWNAHFDKAAEMLEANGIFCKIFTLGD